MRLSAWPSSVSRRGSVASSGRADGSFGKSWASVIALRACPAPLIPLARNAAKSTSSCVG